MDFDIKVEKCGLFHWRAEISCNGKYITSEYASTKKRAIKAVIKEMAERLFNKMTAEKITISL